MTTPSLYQVRDLIDVPQLKKDLAYSDANLSDAMSQQSSLFSHYGVLAAQASSQVDTVKLLIETREAAVYQLLRNKAVLHSEKLTEMQLEKSVAREESVQALKRALIEAKRIEATAKTAVEAFRHRRDMLIQKGLISREEMKGDLRISAATAMNNARDASYEDTKARMMERVRARSDNEAA